MNLLQNEHLYGYIEIPVMTKTLPVVKFSNAISNGGFLHPTKTNQCHHHYHPRNHQTHPSSVILETHRSVHRSLRALYLGRHIAVHWVSLNMENENVLHFKMDIFYFHSSAN